MKYRQWKKNYKKKHGVNPPLELDKRKQRRLARKMARQINKTLPTAAETLTAAINRWAQSIKPALATLYYPLYACGRRRERHRFYKY